MPTIQSMELPRPKNWQEFEDITRDALINRWQSPDLQKHGRSGQSQAGVDIHGPDYLGRTVGIQCKKYKSKLTMKTVRAEILNAEKFPGRLSTLIIATSNEHDSVLQAEIRALSEDRSRLGEFAVGVMFWDEIIAGLALNPASVKAHYPNIIIEPTTHVNSERQLAALELGYFGADIWKYIELMYGEAGWLAQADPDELMAKLRILIYRTTQLLPADVADKIVEAIEATRDGCLKQSDWKTVELQSKRASKRISDATSFLSLLESQVLDVALQIGRIYHHIDELPSSSLQSQIREKMLAILGTQESITIDEAIDKATAQKTGYLWAVKMYGFLDRKIRYRT
ncbi:hypothetical protein ACN9MY_06245 [Pseudoduganella sp. R-31]|uniref:hypothetical protein n=1 Tax=Pseudoduganella sp. R-31 TaxID=3404060 RepID=UPI003CF3E9CA